MTNITQQVFCKENPYHNVSKKYICNEEYLVCIECGRKEKVVREFIF